MFLVAIMSVSQVIIALFGGVFDFFNWGCAHKKKGGLYDGAV